MSFEQSLTVNVKINYKSPFFRLHSFIFHFFISIFFISIFFIFIPLLFIPLFLFRYFHFFIFTLLFFLFFYFYSFTFIGSPQQSISPVQPAEHLSSLHSLTTISSSPHLAQTRTWPCFRLVQFIKTSPLYIRQEKYVI